MSTNRNAGALAVYRRRRRLERRCYSNLIEDMGYPRGFHGQKHIDYLRTKLALGRLNEVNWGLSLACQSAYRVSAGNVVISSLKDGEIFANINNVPASVRLVDAEAYVRHFVPVGAHFVINATLAAGEVAL